MKGNEQGLIILAAWIAACISCLSYSISSVSSTLAKQETMNDWMPGQHSTKGEGANKENQNICTSLPGLLLALRQGSSVYCGMRVNGEPVEVERRQSNTPLSEDQPCEGEEGRGRDLSRGCATTCTSVLTLLGSKQRPGIVPFLTSTQCTSCVILHQGYIDK